MSHPNPHHDPENVRSEDSKFAPKAKHNALKRFTGLGAVDVNKMKYKNKELKRQDKKIHAKY